MKHFRVDKEKLQLIKHMPCKLKCEEYCKQTSQCEDIGKTDTMRLECKRPALVGYKKIGG